MNEKILKRLEKYVQNFEDYMILNSVRVEGVGEDEKVKFEENYKGYRLRVGRTLEPKERGPGWKESGLVLSDPFVKVKFTYEDGKFFLGKCMEKWGYPNGIYMSIIEPKYGGCDVGRLEIPRLMEILNKWAESESKMNIGFKGYLLELEYLI